MMKFTYLGGKKRIRNIIDRLLGRIGYVHKIKVFDNYDDYIVLPKKSITYSSDGLFTVHTADFLRDPHFIKSYELGKNTDEGTLLKNYDIQWRVHVICWAARHAMHLEGDFVDCGVHSGIYARAVINYVNFKESSKKYYLLDSFNGLDEKYSSEEELKRNNLMGYDKEDPDTLFNQVTETFKDFNARIVRGVVPETLTNVDTNKVCFLSIDMNCVTPEIEALEFFWDKMVSGGLIILDDYAYANSTGPQKEAHDMFAKSKNVEILTLPTCQGLIIKP